MATLVVQHSTAIRKSRTPPPHVVGLSLDTSRFKSTNLRSRHLPHCSPGPAPNALYRSPSAPVTPPSSPPKSTFNVRTSSLLHTPESYSLVTETPPVYSIDALVLSKAVDHVATCPLPDPKLVFPWLHGLHQENQIQLAFFTARRRSMRKAPRCLRGITVVKAGGDLTKAKLKGALAPEEILTSHDKKDAAFYDVDPKDGFSVRNFHIQAAKLAMMSDIVVYKDDDTPDNDLCLLAKKCSLAQRKHRERCCIDEAVEIPEYYTYIISNSFSEIEQEQPELVAITAKGEPTDRAIDFAACERQEMREMSKASEIADNVWLGPTPDAMPCQTVSGNMDLDILVETLDAARIPDAKSLRRVADLSASSVQHLEFPASGALMPPTWSHAEVDGLMEVCHWIHGLANPQITPDSSDDGEVDADGEGDILMKPLYPRARKILIHCTDGYTETSLLALAYFMFTECIPVHEAYIRLHRDKKRNFFSYPSDVALLTAIQPRIMQESPRSSGGIPSSLPPDPARLKRLDGSLPSRIFPYMYLGNLSHANNPGLLTELGITRILSIGEPVNWKPHEISGWGAEKLLFVDRVQDNGVDPLTEEFGRCLDFIEQGKSDGTATLVHCRVGVSRSATICIAEVMSSLGLSFPKAYCFVRARRLNVIIQPHLRFAYELLKWEEDLQVKRGQPLRRELEWPSIAREIAAMNKPYTR